MLYLFLKYFNKIISWNVPYKVDTIQLKNLLYLEHEILILVFRVPQSVQKVKTAKFHKVNRIMEQKKLAFKSYTHIMRNLYIFRLNATKKFNSSLI